MMFRKRFLDKSYTNYEVAVIVCITACSQEMDCISITPEIIMENLTGQLNNHSKSNLKEIRNAINSLINKNILPVVDCTDRKWIVETSQCNKIKDADYYVLLKMSEVRKILTLSNKSKFSVLKTYIAILSSMKYENTESYYKACIGTSSINQLCKIANISRPTLLSHIEILETAELLYVFRERFKIKGQESRNSLNVYGRYGDKSKIEFYAKNKRKFDSSITYYDVNKSPAKKKNTETTEEDLKRYVREADPPVDTSDLRTEEEPRRDINSMLDELCNGMM